MNEYGAEGKLPEHMGYHLYKSRPDAEETLFILSQEGGLRGMDAIVMSLKIFMIWVKRISMSIWSFVV